MSSHSFVCKRCKRRYPSLEPGQRPVRCECGWWYYNDGTAVRERYWPRIEPYRTPVDLRRMFAPR
jgi:hypothetical protein